MKKDNDFRDRSSVYLCKKCGRGIKINVLARKEGRVDLCYKCFKENEKRRRGAV